MFKKEARIVKRKNKYCVISHKKNKQGKYRSFGCYNTKAEAKERLGQIYMFKHKKATLLNVLTTISDELFNKGLIHIADAIVNCAEEIAKEDITNNTTIKIGKLINILDKKGQQQLSEQLGNVIPEILACEACGEIELEEHTIKLGADKVYKMASKLKDMYSKGEIRERSFEYRKMKEFEFMLKNGFSLGLPKNFEEYPDNCNNWWEYFNKLAIDRNKLIEDLSVKILLNKEKISLLSDNELLTASKIMNVAMARRYVENCAMQKQFNK